MTIFPTLPVLRESGSTVPGHRPHYPPLTGCNGRWEKAETDRRRRGKREKVRGGTVGTDTGNGKSPVTPKDFNDKKKRIGRRIKGGRDALIPSPLHPENILIS